MRETSPTLYPVEEGIATLEGANETRILAVFEDEYQPYGRAVVRALREHRPHAEVTIAALDKLEAEAKCLDPHLLISCGCHDLVEALGDGIPSWVELFPHPERPWRIRIGKRRWESLNPTLEELVSVLDKTERLVSKMGRRNRSTTSDEA